MLSTLTPSHLKRYKDMVRLLAKYGRAGWLAAGELDELASPQGLELPAGVPAPEELPRDLEALGPTFVKLGQLLSARADLLPVAHLEALARLQNGVEPFAFAEVERIVESELGVRLSKGFREFSPEPLAAASLGQVHRATLRDGRAVAVKVQRPGIRQVVADDLSAVLAATRWLDERTDFGRRYRLAELAETFRRDLLRELDYRVEAGNLEDLADRLAGFPRLVVPRPVADYSKARVLTMELVEGRKVTELGPLPRLELDGSALADELFRAYLQQILVDGRFHADPHPGNVLVTADGRLALLDLGLVGRVGPQLQDRLLRLVLAVAEGEPEEAADGLVALGETRPDSQLDRLRREVSDLVLTSQAATLAEAAVGRTLLRLARQAAQRGVRLPPELALLGRTLLHLEHVGAQLDPDFSPLAVVRRSVAALASQRLRQAFSASGLLAAASELRDLLVKLPGRANLILDKLVRNELAVRVQTIDERLLVAGIQKVANRITLGLVLAALIVGAALLMRVETASRILGYPALAMLCFLGAGIGGLLLVASILWSDIDDRRSRRP
jgi:predicted unusual protein kinase regulating ubiquinone biosynthesis (AarF/ABC1/UbiB family)